MKLKILGITYIHENDSSLAIVDTNGNPIKSGIVLEPANGYGYMFNQDYVKSAQTMLQNQGINTSNMSEAELVGRYILSDNYQIQDEELSVALGSTQDLAQYIKTHFYIDDGKEDSFAIDVYRSRSNDFATSFNSVAIEDQSSINSYETDDYEIGD